MPTIRVADKPTLDTVKTTVDTVKSTVDSVRTAVSTVNTAVSGLKSGATLKTGSVTVGVGETATIPRTTVLNDAIALVGTTYTGYTGTTDLAGWRTGAGSNIMVSGVSSSAITIKGGSQGGGTLYYTYWE